MKILFIGGNGNISWHCVNEALKASHEVYVLNREATLNSRREIQRDVVKLKGDIRNFDEMQEILRTRFFDVVCDFICYNEEHAKNVVALFSGKTKQYIFISSESVYERKTKNLPFKENCPKNNPENSFAYVRDKLKAEEVFINSFECGAFPVTIVRPSYTYDTIVPVSLGKNCYTPVVRYLRNRPVLIAGDGNNLWTFTHSRDFARAFVCLLGNADAIGEDYHITADEWLTWNEATEHLLNAINVKNAQVLHVPLNYLFKTPLASQRDLAYQKVWHNIYDNSKIKNVASGWRAEIPFEKGIKLTIGWLHEKESHRRFDKDLDVILEEITLNVQKGKKV